MSQPYVGEIRMFGGNFAPAGWEFCLGQLLPISENETLFNLIGTTYGGDGQETFALPNLASRIPVHQGSGFTLAQTGGAETVTLTTNQMPSHSHQPLGSSGAATSTDPSNAVWAASGDKAYSTAATNTTMNAAALSNTGGSQPHDNMPPYLGVNFIISMFGIFPSQT
jgi:microcystin-dependent protein